MKIIGFLLFAVMITAELSAAKFYRFVDKEGKTVVSSTLPPEVSQHGYDIVNEMGTVIETIAARKTAAQLLEELATKAEREEKAKQQKEQELLDAILINSYTVISDIERARDSELIAKDRDIMLLKQNIRRFTRLLEDTQTKAARDERLGRPLSETILNEVASFKKRIAQENTEVLKIEDVKKGIVARYSSSIIRFSQLKATEQLNQHQPGDLATEDSRAVIYKCTSTKRCDNSWHSALLYANEYSTTELAWANETTIMMRKPRKDDDISLMLTRVNNPRGNGSSLVLEVRCNKSLKGEELCKSNTVRIIEKGFIPFLK